MGGKKSSGDEVQTRLYAPYVEEKHVKYLDTVIENRKIMISVSPMDGYVNLDAASAFLINSVVSVSVFDLFGSLMGNLDIDLLWNKCFTNTMSRSEYDALVAEEVKQKDEEMIKGPMTDFQVNMRNLNAVSSSSFVVGKAVLEDQRVKRLCQASLKAKEQLLPMVSSCFTTSLNENRERMKRYAETIKGYLLWKTDTDGANYTAASGNALWPFTVLSFEGAALATMEGNFGWRKTLDPRKRSGLSTGLSIASYTVSGAYIGSEILPGWGTVIGAVVGFVVGVALMLFE